MTERRREAASTERLTCGWHHGMQSSVWLGFQAHLAGGEGGGTDGGGRGEGPPGGCGGWGVGEGWVGVGLGEIG